MPAAFHSREYFPAGRTCDTSVATSPPRSVKIVSLTRAACGIEKVIVVDGLNGFGNACSSAMTRGASPPRPSAPGGAGGSPVSEAPAAAGADCAPGVVESIRKPATLVRIQYPMPGSMVSLRIYRLAYRKSLLTVIVGGST